MKVVRAIEELHRAEHEPGAVVVIGTFDGVHRGHQYLLRGAVDRAHALGLQTVVITFDPPPAAVIRPEAAPPRLTDADEKVALIATLGVDVCAVQHFTAEFAQVRAGTFLETVLTHVTVREIWMGADFAFGYKREGDVAFLAQAANEGAFAVHIVPRQRLAGEPISSTRIRESIRAGDLSAASALLGYHPQVSGIVVHGAGRGRDFGYPTANVAPEPAHIVPPTGIYAGYALIPAGRFQAAISVGYNPTFGSNPLSVEAFLLDFDGALWGERITLEFVTRLRDELRFDSVADLLAQMSRDVERTRALLTTHAE